MTLSRYIFELIDTLLEERSPEHVAAGAVLGLFLAASPWNSLQGALLLLLLFLLRTNLFSVATSFLFFSFAGWGTTPWLDSLGLRILTGHPVRIAIWAWAYHAPVLPFTQFYVSWVNGAAFVALLLALPLFVLARIAARQMRLRAADWINVQRGLARWERSGLYLSQVSNPNIKRTARNPVFRLVAIPPLLLSTLAAMIYFSLFFDTQLRHWIEQEATVFNAARVDIAQVRVHLFKGTVDLDGLELADPVSPSKDLVQLDHVHVQIDPTLLLRKKLLIEEMTVSGISFRSNRATSGALASDQMFGIPPLYQRASNDLFPDLARELGIRPFERLPLLIGEGEELQSYVSQRIETLSGPRTLTTLNRSLERTLAALEDDPVRAPAAARQDRAALEKLRREAMSLEATLEPDAKEIWRELGLDRLESNDLTGAVFGPPFLSYLERLSYWLRIARRYMPTGNKEGFFTWSVQALPKGVSVHFGKQGGTPAFLLRHASLISEPEPGTTRGKVNGSVANLTSDPSICNCLTTIDIQGDFPHREIHGARLSVIIDHRQLDFHETMRLGVDGLSLRGWELIPGRELALTTAEATGAIQIKGDFDNDKMRVESEVAISGAQFNARSSSPGFGGEMQEIFQTTAERLKTFRILFTANGQFEQAGFALTSDFGRALATSFREHFDDRLSLLRRALQRNLSEQLDNSRQTFLTRLDNGLRQLSHP